MQERHYKTILYFIIAVILGTLAIQGYWNYKNFEAGKQQLMNEVQVSLDNAVNNYYATKTQERFNGFTFIEESKSVDSLLNIFKSDSVLRDLSFLDSLSKMDKTQIKIRIDLSDRKKESINRLRENKKLHQDTLINIENLDGTMSDRFFKLNDEQDTIQNVFIFDDIHADQFFKRNKNKDSLYNHPLAELTSQVMYSLAAKKVDLKSIDSLLVVEFERKNIDINYSLFLQNPFGKDQSTGSIPDISNYLTTRSNSAFLPKRSFLQINFSNITETLLRRNSIGILISLLFVIAIISCLLYLLKIIKSQKKLAEVKNDLISNITHEFKTPIATIGAAMEGILNFNTTNNAEKNLRYAKISSEQVGKLNSMVEKILETASLDSENLELHKEPKDLVELLKNATTKEAFITHDKNIIFSTSEKELHHPIDVFHFENAINNIIDNAIKYGGNEIEVTLATKNKHIEIVVKDSGNALVESQKKQIFEKFYRVPKGNTHDVKGFGIGLYYTKAIVEKHDGTIDVSVKPTTFKITLPHG